MKTALYACACLALLAMAAAGGIAGYQAAVLPARIGSAFDAQMGATRVELAGQLAATRRELLAEVSATRTGLFRQLSDTGGHLNSQLTDAREAADRRLGDTLARADRALATGEGLRSDLQGVASGTVALLSSATATSDQLRADVAKTTPFVIGSIAATKVTMGQTAKTMIVVAAEAPRVGKAVGDFAAQATGIATDVHTATSEYVKPQPWWKKVLSALLGVAIAGGKILR